MGLLRELRPQLPWQSYDVFWCFAWRNFLLVFPRELRARFIPKRTELYRSGFETTKVTLVLQGAQDLTRFFGPGNANECKHHWDEELYSNQGTSLEVIFSTDTLVVSFCKEPSLFPAPRE